MEMLTVGGNMVEGQMDDRVHDDGYISSNPR